MSPAIVVSDSRIIVVAAVLVIVACIVYLVRAL